MILLYLFSKFVFKTFYKKTKLCNGDVLTYPKCKSSKIENIRADECLQMTIFIAQMLTKAIASWHNLLVP